MYTFAEPLVRTEDEEGSKIINRKQQATDVPDDRNIDKLRYHEGDGHSTDTQVHHHKAAKHQGLRNGWRKRETAMEKEIESKRNETDINSGDKETDRDTARQTKGHGRSGDRLFSHTRSRPSPPAAPPWATPCRQWHQEACWKNDPKCQRQERNHNKREMIEKQRSSNEVQPIEGTEKTKEHREWACLQKKMTTAAMPTPIIPASKYSNWNEVERYQGG
jgi:hypothetical protein